MSPAEFGETIGGQKLLVIVKIDVRKVKVQQMLHNCNEKIF